MSFTLDRTVKTVGGNGGAGNGIMGGTGRDLGVHPGIPVGRKGFYKGEGNTILNMSGFSSADGDDVTPNQLHKEAEKSGFSKGFDKFLDIFNVAKENGALDWLKKKIGSGDSKDLDPNDVPKKTTKFLGMPKPVAIGVAVILVSLLGYGIYKLVKAVKK